RSPRSTRFTRIRGGGESNHWGWWPRPESNQRHTDFQSAALPTELLGLPAARAIPAPFLKGRIIEGKARLPMKRGAAAPLFVLRFRLREITCPSRPCHPCRPFRRANGRRRRPSSLRPVPQPSRRS